jgi:hypothetical protein
MPFIIKSQEIVWTYGHKICVCICILRRNVRSNRWHTSKICLLRILFLIVLLVVILFVVHLSTVCVLPKVFNLRDCNPSNEFKNTNTFLVEMRKIFYIDFLFGSQRAVLSPDVKHQTSRCM